LAVADLLHRPAGLLIGFRGGSKAEGRISPELYDVVRHQPRSIVLGKR